MSGWKSSDRGDEPRHVAPLDGQEPLVKLGDEALPLSLGNDQLLALLAALGPEVAVISAQHNGGRRISDIPVKDEHDDDDDEATVEGETAGAEASARTIGGAPTRGQAPID